PAPPRALHRRRRRAARAPAGVPHRRAAACGAAPGGRDPGRLKRCSAAARPRTFDRTGDHLCTPRTGTPTTMHASPPPSLPMQSFDYKTSYATPRRPVFARNIVSTSHPLAAQAGLRMIAAGGNAVDAAIAAAAVMTIVEPCSNGLGSDSFCILWDGQRLHGLNASGPAPALWTPQYFRDHHGGG